MDSGTVIKYNAKLQRFFVKDRAGKFTAFLLEAPAKVKAGDAIEWVRMPGQTHLAASNRSTNASLQVVGLAFGVSRIHVEALLKL